MGRKRAVPDNKTGDKTASCSGTTGENHECRTAKTAMRRELVAIAASVSHLSIYSQKLVLAP